MKKGWRDEPAVTGAYQRGTVRHDVAPGPMQSVVRQCRLCQRVTGNAFLPLLETPSGWRVTRPHSPE